MGIPIEKVGQNVAGGVHQLGHYVAGEVYNAVRHFVIGTFCLLIGEKIAKFCFGLLFEIYNPEYHDITDWLILHHLTYFASFDLSLAYDQVHLFQAFFPFVRKSKEQGPISCANNSRKSCLPTTSQTDLGPSRKTS